MKLIRDKYVDIIEEDRWYKETDKNKQKRFLVKKIFEELSELNETDFRDINEWADVCEVMFTFIEHMKIDMAEIEAARKKKKDEKGGFSDFVILKG